MPRSPVLANVVVSVVSGVVVVVVSPDSQAMLSPSLSRLFGSVGFEL